MPNNRKIIPDNAPFSPEENEWLNHFFTQMTPEQANWLSGFVTGYQALQITGSTPASPTLEQSATYSAPDASAAPATPPAKKPNLTILYGTESGNSEALAADAKKLAQKKGIKANIIDMADLEVTKLAGLENLMVIVSTWGEGDPPERAVEFYKQFMSDAAPNLDGLNYSVLGLGDTSYEQFCKMGKDFDARLETLGAKRIHDRIDCDVDYESAANSWLGTSLDALLDLNDVGAVASTGTDVTVETAMPAATSVVYDKKNPFPATIIDKVVLNGTGSAKETLHVELSLEESGLSYKPGDSLAVVPTNCPDVVESILAVTGLSKDEAVTNKQGDSFKLFDYLLRESDITGLSKTFIQKYAELGSNEELKELLKPENKEKLQEFIYGREIVDLLVDYPIKDLKAQDLAGMFRKLPPRLYSIASSLQAHPDEVHLTVAAVRYFSHERERKGVCSTYLADRVDKGEQVLVYIQPNKHFALPEDGDTPIIMVGPGTGIAPFRAFIEERKETGASGKNWLFFGDQHYSTDFLYQLEWQDHFKDGVLSKIDLAFSRDTPQKVYVQHKMLEKSAELFAWLEDGAHFYVCGDASKMAHDVHSALKEIIMKEGKLSEADADEYLTKLKKEKRYQRDVY